MSDIKNESIISVITTTEQQQGTEGFLPGFGSKTMIQKTSLNLENFRNQLDRIANQMKGIGEGLKDRSGGFSVDELSLSLTIDAHGEVSLLGLTSGSVGAASTIKLVFRRNIEEIEVIET